MRLSDNLCDVIQRNQVHRVVVMGDVLHTHERLHTMPMNGSDDAF